MCQEAARKMDLCAHGGMVKDGSPDTEIGGLAAARWGDGHICPMHPPGRITSASTTVFINGVGAARKLDFILCAAPATPAPGAVFSRGATVSGKAAVVSAEASVYKGGSGEKGPNPYSSAGGSGAPTLASAGYGSLGGGGGGASGGGGGVPFGALAGSTGMPLGSANDKRFDLKPLFDPAAALEFGLSIMLSIARAFGLAAPPAPGPDAVKIGCGTVFIGG